MGLNFIDISSWQANINLDMVKMQNPLHGIIVKSTESTNYVNPYCDKWVQWAIHNNLPWGFYHFLNHHDPVEEAKFFIKHTLNYFKDGVPIADFEGNIVANYGALYLQKFVETVYHETGVKPMIYCNLSTIQGNANGFKAISDYPLWLAQWASAKDQVGFNPSPWQSGSYAPFPKMAMQQYTDHGKLNGYSGYLDFDLFFGTVEDWNKLAGKDITPKPIPEPDIGRDAVIDAIIELLEKLR